MFSPLFPRVWKRGGPHPGKVPVRLVTASALAFALAASLGACNNDPYGLNAVTLAADTVKLAAPTADSANVGSAFDVTSTTGARFPERSADAQAWDFSVRQVGAQLYFRPYPGSQNQVGAGIIGPTSDVFADVKTAPSRNQYGDTAVVVQEGKTYLLRSRQFGESGVVCVRYSKITPVEVKPAAGTVRLAYATNVGCNDRRLKE
jgi:hypothetical protein